jgi:drug/metabolite transporter (DMT)-like permease
MNAKLMKGHAAMFVANILWGSMAPASKMVLSSGVVNPISLTTIRMIGASAFFWLASAFAPKEKVTPSDLKLLFFAAFFGIVFNQGMYILGVSMTSPINAGIIATSTPIVTMIIAAFYLKEPITNKKVLGILVGAAGALSLILSGGNMSGGGNPLGDLCCLVAQTSFSIYVVVYKDLISRYSPITLMKWMFVYSAICVIPFSYTSLSQIEWSAINGALMANLVLIVTGGTFLAYLLLPIGQRNLRPTVMTMYNYMQPIVASIITVIVGLDSFGVMKGVAIVLVFLGVYIVTQSKSREQMLKEGNKD